MQESGGATIVSRFKNIRGSIAVSAVLRQDKILYSERFTNSMNILYNECKENKLILNPQQLKTVSSYVHGEFCDKLGLFDVNNKAVTRFIEDMLKSDNNNKLMDELVSSFIQLRKLSTIERISHNIPL